MSRIILFNLFFLFLISCSSTKNAITTNDDAVRIKKEYWNEFKIEPNTGNARNPSALRGNVYKVVKSIKQDSCSNENPITIENNYVLFLDRIAEGSVGSVPEKIPLEKIDLVGENELLNLGKNWFENFNDPLNPKAIREVPVDSMYFGCDDSKNCGCENADIDFSIGIDCIERQREFYFLEVRSSYNVYVDNVTISSLAEPIESYSAEVALGYRFGQHKQWGIGLLYSLGVPVYNRIAGLEQQITRPVVLLHGRYNFEEFLCMFPFVYGNFGFTVDKLSLDMAAVWNNDDCNERIEDLDLGLDFGLPISYGFGAGLEIPIVSFMDVAFDFGYRKISFGETLSAGGIANVPVRRSLDMFMFRLGLTF